MPKSETQAIISMVSKEIEVNIKRKSLWLNGVCLREGGTRKETRYFGELCDSSCTGATWIKIQMKIKVYK